MSKRHLNQKANYTKTHIEDEEVGYRAGAS